MRSKIDYVASGNLLRATPVQVISTGKTFPQFAPLPLASHFMGQPRTLIHTLVVLFTLTLIVTLI